MMTPNDYPANVYMVAPYDPHLLYYPAAMPEVIVQSIPVSADFVPFLIGKQGKAIKRLSNQSNTVIKVSETGNEHFGREWKHIQIIGVPKDVDRAKKLIYLKLERYLRIQFLGLNHAQSRMGNDDEVEDPMDECRDSVSSSTEKATAMSPLQESLPTSPPFSASLEDL